MQIIIIGAGMGGLTAALNLHRHGHDVRVFEKVAQMRPVGAAISLWPNGVKCLDYLGLGEQIKALGGSMRSMAYLDGISGEVMCDFSLAPLVAAAGQAPYPVARAELQAMLVEEFRARAGDAAITFGAHALEVSQDTDRVSVTFADGSTASADVLIGADGTHSFVRTHVLGEPVERRYAGYVNFNGLVACADELAPETAWTTFVGEGKRASFMPVADGRFYFFIDVPLPHDALAGSDLRAELREHFAGWAPPVHRLIDRLDPATTNRIPIHDIDPFHTWTKGRVALLGDAAHATTPDIGQGGCQAMEDAIVLGMELGTTTTSVANSLERYAQRRSGRAAEMILRARKRCEVTHGFDPAITQAWYEELRSEGDGRNIINGILGNIHGNPLDAGAA